MTFATLEGSFSAVSKPIFPSKYAFFSIFQDLQDSHTFAPFQIQKFSKFSSNFFPKFVWKFCKIFHFFNQFRHFSHWFWWIFLRISRIFFRNCRNLQIFQKCWEKIGGNPPNYQLFPPKIIGGWGFRPGVGGGHLFSFFEGACGPRRLHVQSGLDCEQRS